MGKYRSQCTYSFKKLIKVTKLNVRQEHSTLNLSHYNLTTVDKSVLDLGLSFIPTNNRLHTGDINESLKKLTRSMKLRDFFGDRDKFDRDNPLSKFIPKSTWEPPEENITDETLEAIEKLEIMTEKVLKQYPKKDDYHYIKNMDHNITREQRQSINKLRNNNDIIIKPADKGGMTCIMDKTAYNNEAYRQLNNNKYYTKIEQARKTELCTKLNTVLEGLRDEFCISNKQFHYLKASEEAKDRNFYLLPKVHKPVDKWPNINMPEGRPIVSDCNSDSRRISDYIDYHIKPLCNKHKSYIKDTYDFLRKVKNQKIGKNHLLVTGDVTALYTNMNINRTLAVLKLAFKANPRPSRPDDEIIALLELIMKNNDFQFNNELFLQIFGTAMGKSFAPNLANLYLIDFDKQAMNGFRIKPSLFYRFLDDIFFVWTGTRDELKEFETFLNSIIPNIKITLTVSDTEVNFLDTTIFKHNNDNEDDTTLKSKIYFKTTDTHELLHTASFHPPHTTLGVLKSQIIRFKRLSSFKEDFDTTCNILFKVLCKRGYNRRLLRKTKHDIWFVYNSNLKKTEEKRKAILPIVIPYSPISSHLVREWKRIISQSHNFTNLRTVAAYKKHKNLKQLLTSSK